MEEEWKVANSRKILNQKPKTNVRIKSNTSKSNSIPVNKEIKEKNLASNEKKKSQATTAATTPKTKKIPTKNIELFDLIEAQLNVPTKKNKNSSTKSNNTTLHEPTNPIDKKNSTLLERVKILKIDNQSTNEFIVVKKKRKKKLSTLKKRILLERLRRHAQNTQYNENKIPSELTRVEERTIVICDYISTATLNECDDDEIAQMLDDAKEFLEPFGRVLSFEFLRIDPPEIRAIYSDLEEARAAVNTLNGLVLGGEAIRTYSLSDVQSITSTAPFCADVPTKLPVFSHSDFNAYVTLYNAVQLDDIEDEDEAQETLRDISYLCQPYGVPSNISLKIFHNSSDFYKIEEFPAHHYVEYSNHIIPELNHPQDEESEQELDFPVAMIKFSDFQRTISQAEVIHGKIIGGAEIQISFYDFWCFEQADYRPENIISLHDLRDTYCGIRFIYSKGLISIGDIIAEATSSLREMILHQLTSRLGDVITHLRPFIPIVQTSHQSEIILAGLHFLDAMEIFQLISQLYGGVSNNPFLEKLSSIDLVISLFAPRSNQQNCDFLTICHGYPSYHNGSFLHFCQETILVVGGFIAMEDLEDLKTFPEEIIAIKKDLLSLFEIDTEISSNFYCKSCHFVTTPYGGSPICYQFQSNNPVVAVNLEFSKRSEAEDVMLALHGTLLGGETIIGELVLCPPSELQSLKPSEENVLDPPIPSISDEVNINSIDKSSVPKLPKHEIPSHPIPRASDDMNVIVKEFLSTLASLQQRAKEKDPLNAKRKERFVMGLKQSINTVKSGRSKLILLAPDTEDSDIIDDKISILIDEAHLRDIPIMYSLKRRQLGKAASSSMKQSVISICNPEGANDLYKVLLRFIDESKL